MAVDVATALGLPPDKLRRLLLSKAAFIRFFLRIKSQRGVLVPLQPRAMQKDLLRALNDGENVIVLKARQLGCTTIVQAHLYHETISRRMLDIVTVSDEKEKTQMIFEKFKLFQECMPEMCRPVLRYDSVRRMHFTEARNTVYIGTAGAKSFGRGMTLTHGHLTEFAWWPRTSESQIYSGLSEALQYGQTAIESTPNGPEGLFYEMWQDAKAKKIKFVPYFYPWWWEEQYRGESPATDYSDEESELARTFQLDAWQIQWRREKRASLKRLFAQEYPENDTECFISFGGTYFPGDILSDAHDGAIGCLPGAVAERKYLITWDIGAKVDAAVGHVIDITDKVMQIVDYQRLGGTGMRIPYPAIQSAIDAQARRFPGRLIIEANGPGQVVSENIATKNEAISISARSKQLNLEKLYEALDQRELKWRDVPQLDREIRQYRLDDSGLVQDSVMSLALGIGAAANPPKRNWENFEFLKI